MKSARCIHSTAVIAVSALLLSIGVSAPALALEIGLLDYSQCADAAKDDLFTENQRYWFPYTSDEQLTAGGDGTCYVGFPDAERESALVLVDGVAVEVFPVASTDRDVSIFTSADHGAELEIHITGGDSTCVPDSESCCGEYTYATITVRNNGAVKSVKAANYTGG